VIDGEGAIIEEGRLRTTPAVVEKEFSDLAPSRIAMEAGMQSLWVSSLLTKLGHEVLVANVRELRAITHSDRKSDKVDARKLARYARLDPQILRPITHRSLEMHKASRWSARALCWFGCEPQL
jgi:transposase